jgi:hypothetical protein
MTNASDNRTARLAATRSAKIDRIREQIAAGTYLTDAKLDRALELLCLREFVGPELAASDAVSAECGCSE